MPKPPYKGFEIEFGQDEGTETLVPRSLKTDGSSGDNAAALDALRLMLDMRA